MKQEPKIEFQRVPENMVALQQKIIAEAQKRKYAVSKIGALRIIADSYAKK
jgi:hypothetical protein